MSSCYFVKGKKEPLRKKKTDKQIQEKHNPASTTNNEYQKHNKSASLKYNKTWELMFKYAKKKKKKFQTNLDIIIKYKKISKTVKNQTNR